MEIPAENINKMAVRGSIVVTEEIRGGIDFVMEISRCNLDMKICEKYDNVNVKGMCKKFVDKTAFYSAALESIHPQLKCPIKPGNYTAHVDIDLNLFSIFPIEGFVWITTFKMVATDKGSKTKKIVCCLNSETKIVRAFRKNLWYLSGDIKQLIKH